MNLKLCGISVHFTLKKVLTNLNVTFKEGQIHAILGENGAGKSTLAKVISGELKPGKGQILITESGGNTENKNPPESEKKEIEVVFQDAKAAIQRGICHVHQRPLLAQSISVKENLLLGVHKTNRKYFEDLCSLWIKDVPLNKKLKDTSGDQRFFIALTGALLKNPKILILDEPSALLDSKQRTFLYTQLQKLAVKGLNIIVITHDIKEALTYCDTITLLKDGEVLRSFEKNQAEESQITELLFGTEKNYADYNSENASTDTFTQFHEQSYEHSTKKSEKSPKNLSLKIQNLTAKPLNRPSLFDINFTAESGQITLIQGLAESGLGTLEQIITGIDSSHTKGTITLTKNDETGAPQTDETGAPAGTPATTIFECNLKTARFNTRTLRKKMGIRVGIIPTDRTFTGSNPVLTIEEMLQSKNTQKLISAADVQITSKEKAENLSGGMLQRLIFARETIPEPDLLILCEPLQGLDKFACETLFKKLSNFASTGMMIIVLSSTPFPHTLCKKIYNLESGYLQEQINLHSPAATAMEELQ